MPYQRPFGGFEILIWYQNFVFGLVGYQSDKNTPEK